MHHMGITLDLHILFHRNAAETADFADVVASKVDKHVVLGTFLFVREKLAFQRRVLRRRLSARTGSGKGKRMQHAVLKLYKGFGEAPATSISSPEK